MRGPPVHEKTLRAREERATSTTGCGHRAVDNTMLVVVLMCTITNVSQLPPSTRANTYVSEGSPLTSVGPAWRSGRHASTHAARCARANSRSGSAAVFRDGTGRLARGQDVLRGEEVARRAHPFAGQRPREGFEGRLGAPAIAGVARGVGEL